LVCLPGQPGGRFRLWLPAYLLSRLPLSTSQSVVTDFRVFFVAAACMLCNGLRRCP
jgi:hypothetical protein